jgi:hypothetical protein
MAWTRALSHHRKGTEYHYYNLFTTKIPFLILFQLKDLNIEEADKELSETKAKSKISERKKMEELKVRGHHLSKLDCVRVLFFSVLEFHLDEVT